VEHWQFSLLLSSNFGEFKSARRFAPAGATDDASFMGEFSSA
jgi:hypothetical protein